MRRRTKEATLLALSMGGYTLMATAIALMIPALHVPAFVTGGMFWLFLAAGIVFQVILSARRRKWQRGSDEKRPVRGIGLIRFFRGVPGTVSDILLILSLAGLVLSLWLTGSSGAVCYIFLALSVFSFAAHCIFNGKNYQYVRKL